MLDFAYQSGDSFLHRLDPKIKFPVILVCILIILLTSGITGTVTAFLLITALLLLSKLQFSVVFRPVKRLWVFLILIFLMNALFHSNGTCMISYWLVCVSRSGLAQGYNIVLHTAAVTVISSIYIRTTTSVEIMKSLEFYMQPLRMLNIPTHDIALIISIALQFIPVFFSDIDRIRKSQTARGADFIGGSIFDKAKAVYPLIIPAFISAFRRADELALAIDARGFQSEREIRK